ncbi:MULTISPECIES: tyrosine-type recombinase/integrase [Mycobacteroides]|uniref:tyrosine-type recombinase/integrase n=1 Tax=Mycobacteroides TaxID=670516 RepID=UPI0009939DE9|nr:MULTISPECIES: tyrosine-type recombinase/integrase [Mycobacteroides]MDM3948269.1 tyrosine-type recombinase/integrase [Mycobacteroides abscessus]SLI38806.1 putative phage integrase [Mycobacteroides abscessus subsp. massiliense]
MAGRPRLEIGTYGNIAARPKNGKWLAETRYRDSDGATRAVTATDVTEAKAKAKLRAKLKERQHGGTEELTRESPYALLLDRWLDSLEEQRRPENAEEHLEGTLEGATIDAYRAAAEKIIKPGIGAVTLRELNTQRMDTYLDTVTSRKRHVRTVLMQSCALGVRWNLLEYNPVRETKKVVRSRSDKRTLTHEDTKALMIRTVEWQKRKPGQGGPHRGVDMTTLVALLLATAERTGEVLAIRWDDIEHLDDRTRPVEVTISGTITLSGKRKPLPKSNHGYRIVKLPEWARDELLNQRARGLPYDLVFPSRAGTPRLINNVNRSWREIRGEDFSWVTPRTFRKTTGTAVEREHGADAAAKQLGHSSPEVTRKHYINRAHEAGDYTDTLEKLNPFSPNKDRPKPDLRIVGGE